MRSSKTLTRRGVQAAWTKRQARVYAAQWAAATSLQRFARGWAVRRRLRRQVAAATLIQATWRGRLCRWGFLWECNQIVIVQVCDVTEHTNIYTKTNYLWRPGLESKQSKLQLTT
jgi:hypothetical protein